MERHLQSSIQSRQLTSRLPPFGLPVVGLLCLFSWLATQAFAQGPAATRWRVLWGGGETREYAGTFALDNGTLQGIKPLGVSSASNVEVRSVQNRELEIRSHSSQFGGFDVGVAGGPQAQLTLQFQNVDGKGKWVGDHWTLEELLRGPKTVSLDGSGNRCVIDRVPGDVLRITTKKPHVVYEPGEEIALDGAIAYSQLPPGTARCKVQLLREEDEQLLEERIQPLEVDASGSSPLFRIPRFHAPQADGVYEIKISIEGKKRNGVFARGNSVLTRTVELVVVGKVPAPSEAQAWQNKRVFHLGQTEEPFPLLRKVGQWLQGESEDDRSRAIDLAPGETEYIAMEVVEPGRPLLVGVKYQSIPGSECIVSIMEPNASGKLDGLTLDSGYQVPRDWSKAEGEWMECEFVLWPRSKQTKLVLHNPSESAPAKILELSVRSGPTKLPRFQLDRTEIDKGTKNGPGGPSSEGKRVFFHMDKPFLQDTFGGIKRMDPITNRPIDTWSTFYGAIDHLAQYCHAMGYNGASVIVASDGGTLFPSRTLQPTPRLDSGTFGSEGRDIDQKDVVELLLRIFEREGLQLVMAFDLGGPLSEVEKSRLPLEDADRALSVDQLSIDGNMWPIGGRTGAGLVLYDPLSAPFTNAVSEVFREVTHRYGSHQAWAGNAIRLGPRSHFNFAGDLWGYSAANIEAFSKTIQARLPTDKQQIKRLLTGSSKSAWLQWRCSELAKNFDRYARELRKGNEQRNLFLLTSAFFESAPTELAFQDPLLASSDPQGVLTAHGIDPRMSEYSGNVVFLRGETSFVSESLIGQRWSHLASRDLKLDESMQGLQGDGSQLNRVPRGVWLRDAHLDMALGTKAKEVLLFPQYVEPEGVAEKGLVRRLAAKDQAYVFDGGWFPALHSSEGQKEIRAVLGLLPRQGLKDVASSSPEQDPLVVVRNGVDGSWNYFLLINSSPWTVPIACDWNLELSSIDWMSDPDRCGVSTKNGLPDEFLLQPCSIAAFRVGDDRLRLVSWKVHPSPTHRSEAQRSLDLFGQRLNQTAFSGGNGLLRNGDFEEGNTNGASIESWTTSLLPTTMLRLDDQDPLSGKRSLRMENQTSSASTWIQSTPFEPPMTGRLAVDFYARLESGSEPVQLIISISGGRANGSKLQVSREVILQPNSKRSIVDPKNPSSIAPKWVYYQVPLLQDQDASDLTELQLAFDLRGKGAMGLDRVVVHDYFLLDEERRQLRSEVFAAKRELELGNLGATRRLLDSYWSRFLNEFGPVDSKSEGVGQKTTALRASTASLSDQGMQRDTSEERTRSNAKGGNPREESKGWLQRWRENWGRNRKK